MKIRSVLLKISLMAVIACLVLTGCGSAEPADRETEAQNRFDPDAFMNEIQINLTALYECDAETFFAQVLYDESYLAAGHMEGNNFVPEVLYPEGEPVPAGYEMDPSFSAYYPTMNLGTIHNARQNLSFYLTDEMVDQLFEPEEFFETPEMLYIRRGSRGYGSTLCVPESARYLGEQNEEQLVEIDYEYFENYDYTTVIHFVKSSAGWKISRVEPPDA